MIKIGGKNCKNVHKKKTAASVDRLNKFSSSLTIKKKKDNSLLSFTDMLAFKVTISKHSKY